MFRKTSLFATTFLLGTALGAWAEQIAVISHGQAGDPFWDVVKKGVEDGARDFGMDVTYASPKSFDVGEMAALIDAAVDRKVESLVISLPDADKLGPSVERAVAAGIPVISMNSGSDEAFLLGVMLHVGQNEFAAGKAAGEKLTELGGTNAICVNQEVGNIALDLRCAGFAEGFTGQTNMLSTTMDPDMVVSVVRGALQADPAVDAIMALGAGTVGVPAISAVEAEGRTGKVLVATFDLSDGFLQAILDGRGAFAIDQQQYKQGYLPVGLLKEYFAKGDIPRENVQTGPNLVDVSTAADFLSK